MSQQPTQQYGVYISPDQMYTEVRATRDAVSTLTQGVDGLRRDLEGVAGLETRVRALETRLASVMQPIGAAGGLAGLGSLLYSLIQK